MDEKDKLVWETIHALQIAIRHLGKEVIDIKKHSEHNCHEKPESFLKQNSVAKQMDSGVFSVKSQNNPNKNYEVILIGEAYSCNCEDFFFRQHECKHIFAVKDLMRA